MKKIILTVLIGISFQTSFGQTKEKDEAANVFKEIVKCYYTKDCDKFYSYFNDSITFINLTIDTLLSSKPIIEMRKICGKFDKIIAKTLTFENYLDNYTIEVLSYEDYSTSDRKSLAKYVHPNADGGFGLAYINAHHKYYTKNDFFVMGDIPTKTDQYIGAPFFLVLRKTNQGWKIFAMST
jgi:hypothetical protein